MPPLAPPVPQYKKVSNPIIGNEYYYIDGRTNSNPGNYKKSKLVSIYEDEYRKEPDTYTFEDGKRMVYYIYELITTGGKSRKWRHRKSRRKTRHRRTY